MRHSLFSNYGGDDVIFMNNWWDFDVLGEIFILLEPFFVWSHLTTHFNQKVATYGGNYIEVHHLENRKCLKIAIFCLKCCVRVICVFFVKKKYSIKGKMDSLSTPRNIASLDGSCYEAIDSSISQNICWYLEMFSMQSRKSITVKDNEKRMNIANFVYIYIYIYDSQREKHF